MKIFLSALSVELFKIRKSKVIWLTLIAATIAPLMAGFFMFALKYPDLVKDAGLLGAQAQIAGEASWPAYLNLHAQMLAIGGILIYGFTMSWVFGREYADGTIKDLLVLPYSRIIIVVAKFSAVLITNVLISIYIVLLGFLLGWGIGLPGWSGEIIGMGLKTLFIVTILTNVLSTPAAFIASYGQGYLAPLGFVIITLVLSQIIAAAGFGEFFPWSIPAMYSGVSEESLNLNLIHWIIIFVTSVSGIGSTIYWWLFADQH